MEALAAITLPHVLHAAYSTLTIAWTHYNTVQEQKAQCKALLQRCTDLAVAVANHANRSGLKSNDPMLAHARSLDIACMSVAKAIATLASNGFAWRLLHQNNVRQVISSADIAVQAACDKFNINAHMTAHKLRVEMAAAREQDQADLAMRLDALARNDQLILNALQAGDQKVRRLEELVIAFTKYHRKARIPDDKKTDVFIASATSALQRLSNTANTVEIPHWSLTSLEVTFDRSEESAQLGAGGFGCVYKGDWNGQVVAVKEMYVQDARLLDNETLVSIRREIQIWSRLAHPHILPFYGACIETSQPFVVSKLCANGSAIQFLKSFPDTDRISLLHEVALGMSYLHDAGIIHADLKGVNILIGDDRKALICDFGLAKLEDELSTAGKRSSTRPIEGSTRWMAPERWEEMRLDFPCDVFSYGVTAWELYSGQVPFHGIADRVLFHWVVNKKERPSRPESLTCGPLWNIITTCWDADPKKRPTFPTLQAEINQLTSFGTGPEETTDSKADDELAAMHNRGVDHVNHNRFTDAEVVLKEVVARREKRLGPEHKDTLLSMSWLARTYYGQDRSGDAVTLLKQVVAGEEKVLGPEHRSTLGSLYWLGLAYYKQNRYGDAEAPFKHIVARQEQTLGPEHKDTIQSLHWLAKVSYKLNRYDNAEILFKRIVNHKEKTLGSRHKDTLHTLYALAQVYYYQHRYRDAETLFEQVVAGQEKAFGPEHEEVLKSTSWLALVYKERQRYRDAELLFKRTISISEKALGAEHNLTLTAKEQLAQVYKLQRRQQ